jgi:hypothetical protein
MERPPVAFRKTWKIEFSGGLEKIFVRLLTKMPNCAYRLHMLSSLISPQMIQVRAQKAFGIQAARA